MVFLFLCLLAIPVQAKCPGDANQDGKVDPTDLGYVSSYLGCPMDGSLGKEQLKNCCMADMNEDERVDELDVELVLFHMGEECDDKETDDDTEPT